MSGILSHQLSEYRNHTLVHETNKFFVDKYLQSRANGVSIGATPLYSKVMNKHQMIYCLDFKDQHDANTKEQDSNKKLKTDGSIEIEDNVV